MAESPSPPRTPPGVLIRSRFSAANPTAVRPTDLNLPVKFMEY